MIKFIIPVSQDFDSLTRTLNSVYTFLKIFMNKEDFIPYPKHIFYEGVTLENRRTRFYYTFSFYLHPTYYIQVIPSSYYYFRKHFVFRLLKSFHSSASKFNLSSRTRFQLKQTPKPTIMKISKFLRNICYYDQNNAF